MSDLVELTDPDHCTPGTVGPPGRRVFYLQARQGPDLHTWRLEKQQVAAIATYLAELLTDLPEPEGPAPEREVLEEPVDAAWIVGSIGVGVRDETDRIVVALEELLADVPDDVAGLDARRARVHLTRGQAAHLVSLAAQLVTAGRPPCPLCGKPVDVDGHACVKSNGHGHA